MSQLTFVTISLLISLVSGVSLLPEEKLENAANCFSLRLFKQLAYEEKSLVSSPLSLFMLLSLLRFGAGGKTAEELKEVLCQNDMSVLELQDAVQAKMKKMKNVGVNTFMLSNSVWFQRTYDINDNFKAIAFDSFSAGVFSVDFEKRPHQAKEKINTWINSATDGLIPTFLQEELDLATVMVMINAIYFKGQWAKRFNPEITRRGIFHNRGSNINTSQVHMMTQQAKFNYKYDSELKSEILEIPYTGNNLTMTIFLPHEEFKFEDFELSLTCEKFESGLQPGLLTVVDITMPIFEQSSNVDLQKALWQMGVQRIFDISANLSGIGKNLYVTKSVQNTVFSVSEEGSEGAATTMAVAGKRTVSHPPDFVYIRLDRPFLFVIQHTVSKLILFIGRVIELPNS